MITGEPDVGVVERVQVAVSEGPAAEARSRFHVIAHLLPITGLEEYLMVEAAMVAARAYARECVEADRSVRGFGAAGAEPAVPEHQEWERSLQRLGDALRV
jgi:hypothetical protein